MNTSTQTSNLSLCKHPGFTQKTPKQTKLIKRYWAGFLKRFSSTLRCCNTGNIRRGRPPVMCIELFQIKLHFCTVWRRIATQNELTLTAFTHAEFTPENWRNCFVTYLFVPGCLKIFLLYVSILLTLCTEKMRPAAPWVASVVGQNVANFQQNKLW